MTALLLSAVLLASHAGAPVTASAPPSKAQSHPAKMTPAPANTREEKSKLPGFGEVAYPLGESFNALRAVFQQYGGWVAVNAVGGELEEPAEGAGGTNMMQAYSLLASDL